MAAAFFARRKRGASGLVSFAEQNVMTHLYFQPMTHRLTDKIRTLSLQNYEALKLDGEAEDELGILTPGMAEVAISPGGASRTVI